MSRSAGLSFGGYLDRYWALHQLLGEGSVKRERAGGIKPNRSQLNNAPAAMLSPDICKLVSIS